MPVVHHRLNTRSSEGSQNLALPSINGEARNHEKGVNSVRENSVVMITRTDTNTRSAKRIIYRSIPPSIQNFTLSDMLGPRNSPRQGVKKKKMAQLSGNTPSDFAKRFFSRPTTQPKVIEFTTDTGPEMKRRGVNGFFPPVKLRVSHKSQGQQNVTNTEELESCESDGAKTSGTTKSAPLFLSRVFRSGSDTTNLRAKLSVTVQSADKVLTPLLPKQAVSDSNIHALCGFCKLTSSFSGGERNENVRIKSSHISNGNTEKNIVSERQSKNNITLPKKVSLGRCLAPGDLISSLPGVRCVRSASSETDSKHSGSAKLRSKESAHLAPFDRQRSAPGSNNVHGKSIDADDTDTEQQIASKKIFLTESKRTHIHVKLCTAVDDTIDSETQEQSERVDEKETQAIINTPDNSNIPPISNANESFVDEQHHVGTDNVKSNNKDARRKVDASTQTKEAIKVPTDTLPDVEQRPVSKMSKSSTIKRHRKRRQETDSLKKRKHAYSAGLRKRQLVFHEATIYMLVPTFKKEFTFNRSLHPVFKPVRPPQPPSRMQFVPTAYSEVRPRSSVSRSSRASTLHMRRTPESIRTAPPMDNITIYPETFDCGDLSYLPPPKRILPKRETPWVFRYKVKRNMNELSRIMASKPPQLVEA